MDKLGNAIKVGDKVAFGKRVGNHGELGVGEVTHLFLDSVRILTDSGRVTQRLHIGVVVLQ